MCVLIKTLNCTHSIYEILSVKLKKIISCLIMLANIYRFDEPPRGEAEVVGVVWRI